MTKIDYKKIWREFKEELTEEYLRLRGVNQENVIPECYRVHAIATGMMLREMDRLDGTQEFHNLLHDLKTFKEDE